MPAWRPVSRRELIAALRRLGFQGPYSGGKHEFMVRGDRVLTIPNPHPGDIGIPWGVFEWRRLACRLTVRGLAPARSDSHRGPGRTPSAASTDASSAPRP